MNTSLSSITIDPNEEEFSYALYGSGNFLQNRDWTGLLCALPLNQGRYTNTAQYFANIRYNRVGFKNTLTEKSSQYTLFYTYPTSTCIGYIDRYKTAVTSVTSDMGEYIMKEGKMAIIFSIYELEDSEKVYSFLEIHNYLIDFLIEAHQQIIETFGKAARITLCLVEDPEIFKDKGLFANIYTNLSVEEALSKMEVLDYKWFLSNLSRA
ncbi:MAG: hypothetical protein ACYDEX_26650, partial [Mobilitalea sp.]